MPGERLYPSITIESGMVIASGAPIVDAIETGIVRLEQVLLQPEIDDGETESLAELMPAVSGSTLIENIEADGDQSEEKVELPTVGPDGRFRFPIRVGALLASYILQTAEEREVKARQGYRFLRNTRQALELGVTGLWLATEVKEAGVSDKELAQILELELADYAAENPAVYMAALHLRKSFQENPDERMPFDSTTSMPLRRRIRGSAFPRFRNTL